MCGCADQGHLYETEAGKTFRRGQSDQVLDRDPRLGLDGRLFRRLAARRAPAATQFAVQSVPRLSGVVDRAGLDMEIFTPFGWTMQCPPHIQQRIVRNFPIQSTGSEILHVACILAERRGIELVAPIHDALMAEANAADAEDATHALDRLMRDASAIVLKGYELPSDCQIVHAGASFYDKNGKDLWDTITNLVTRLDARKVANE
jgi:hypothetical protein